MHLFNTNAKDQQLVRNDILSELTFAYSLMRVIARRNFKETTLALLITFFTTTKQRNRRFFRFSSQSSQENKNDEASPTNKSCLCGEPKIFKVNYIMLLK